MTRRSIATMAPMVSLLFALTGCAGEGTMTPDDDVADDDATEDDDSSNAGDDDTQGYEEAQVADVTAWIDEDIGTIVHVSWEQLAAAEVRVEYSFAEVVGWLTPSRAVGVETVEEILLGIPYDTEVSFRVVNDFGDGALYSDESTIHTEALPAGVVHPAVLVGDEAAWDPSMVFLLLSIAETNAGNPYRYWTLILDRQGRIVWGVRTPAQRITMQTQPTVDGTQLLIDHSSYWAIFDDGAASQVVRMQIDGTILQTYDTPGLHHPFTSTADGSIVWGAYHWPFETLEKLTPAGQQERIWDCQDLHAEVGAGGYCAANTIYWHGPTDTFLYSFYSTNSIAEIDHASGTLLRHFGHLDGSWGFDPPDSAFWWQHGTHYTDEGTLLVSSRVSEHGHETVAREYELDEAGEVLVQVWSFGIGEGVYGSEMGEVARLANGNTLHNYGEASRLREVTPDGTVVWDVAWPEEEMTLGRTSPLSDLYELAP